MKTQVNATQCAGGVVVNGKGEVIVVNQNNNSWSLPKGHIDNGEDALTAAKREIHEETGVEELELIRELGTYARHRIGKYGIGEDTSVLNSITLFLFKTSTHELKPLDPENPEARWVPPEEVAALLTHPKDKEFFLSVKDTW